MTLVEVYVLARNAGGRPTLMHKLVDGTSDQTKCQTEIVSWSRAYLSKTAAQKLSIMLCRRCGKL